MYFVQENEGYIQFVSSNLSFCLCSKGKATFGICSSIYLARQDFTSRVSCQFDPLPFGVSVNTISIYQYTLSLRAESTYHKLSQMTQHSTQHIRDTHQYLHYSFISISSNSTSQSLNVNIELTSRMRPDYTYTAHKMPHSHLPSPSASLVFHSLSTKLPAAGKLQPHYQSRIPHACRNCRCQDTYAHQRSNPLCYHLDS